MLCPLAQPDQDPEKPIRGRERLSGLLTYYHRKAA
jgi:hypothetical protein